jgi:acyl-CoA thioester hydrolase
MAGSYELAVGSLDAGQRHVHDAVFPKYVRRVRRRHIRERLGDAVEDYAWSVVHLEVEFHAELHAGDTVEASVEVAEVGTTSFTTDVTLSRDGTAVASARSVQVTQDLETGETVAVPDEWLAELEA